MSNTVQNPQVTTLGQTPNKPVGLFDALAQKKGSELTDKEKDNILAQIDMKTNAEGYYVDAFGEKVSYNGARTLKKAFTKLPLTQAHADELLACMNDFQYFRRNYCKIVTRSGILRPEPREYQERFENILLDGELIASLQPRQSGKSVTIGTYLLWKALFTPNIIIGIAANKSSTAREILDKVKKIFVNLPIWMQLGLTVWNKGSVEFENGTKILTDSTNGDSFRGYTVHIVVVDEAAFIRHTMWEEFSDSIFPAQSALSWKQTILVSTANGLNHFRNIVVGGRRDDGQMKPGKNGYTVFEVSWREVPRYLKDGSLQNPEDFKADIVRKYGDMYFQQNYGNKFLGSSNTLIEAEVLEVLSHEEPLYINKIFSGLRIYDEPEEGHHYIITVDPKKDGIDDMGVQVVDVTGMPFKQVASANLTESYLTAPGKIFDLGMYYNQGIIVVENNLDQTIVDTLFYHYEYENVYKERGKKIQGFRTTTRTKKQILSFMKKFIEENKVIIRDKTTVEQLYSFIEKANGSFSAEEGYKDDMVMALALVWAVFLEIKNFDDFVGMIDLINAQTKAEEAEQESFAEFFDLGFSDDVDDTMVKREAETFNGYNVYDGNEPNFDADPFGGRGFGEDYDYDDEDDSF